MHRVIVELPRDAKEQIWDHLLSDPHAERAAFGYLRHQYGPGECRLQLLEWTPVAAEGFETRSAYYIELTDAARAAAIKRAHDLNASMVEFHSHLGHWPAAFSASDWLGFREFVPHVWWRLKGRPYVAVVVAQATFDALAWISGPNKAERVDALDVDGEEIRPTAISNLNPMGYETGPV